MYVYYTMYFYYLHLFLIHVLSLDKPWGTAHVSQLLCAALHLSRILYVCQTAGGVIGMWLSHWTITEYIVLYVGLIEIGSFHEI